MTIVTYIFIIHYICSKRKINSVTLDSEPQVGEIKEEINNLASSGFELPDGKRNEELNNLTSPSYPRRNCPARRNPDFLRT